MACTQKFLPSNYVNQPSVFFVNYSYRKCSEFHNYSRRAAAGVSTENLIPGNKMNHGKHFMLMFPRITDRLFSNKN